MTEVIETGIILSFDEIRILLYSMGVRTVEGVYMPRKKFSEADIIQALHHMSGRGLIIAGESAFSIREDLLNMLKIVGNPMRTMVWAVGEAAETLEGEYPVMEHSASDMARGQEYFCYIAENQVVVGERYWKKKDALKLRLFTAEVFERWKEQIAYDYNRG